jgi:hypothetical protein
MAAFTYIISKMARLAENSPEHTVISLEIYQTFFTLKKFSSIPHMLKNDFSSLHKMVIKAVKSKCKCKQFHNFS